MSSKVGRITCFLCGGTHIYPGSRFEAHLINEHGALFDIEFLIKVSLYKSQNSALPELQINPQPKENGIVSQIPRIDSETQTDQEPNAEAESEPRTWIPGTQIHEDAAAILLGRTIKDEPDIGDLNGEEEEEEEEEDGESNLTQTLNKIQQQFLEELEEEPKIQVWGCEICSAIFKKISLIRQHMGIAHELQPAEFGKLKSEEMTEEEFDRRVMIEKRKERLRESCSESVAPTGEKRKVVGKEWEPNSFSSRFTCLFCTEQFRKDYKLKLHLMMKHKDQPAHLMDQAKEELIKAKLDGCVHKCGLCNNKYNSIANFTRHIKDVHNISRLQYKSEYGSSEIVSRTFTCELCQKEVKHTRNIIGAHMKMVHLISWKEYQDIIFKLKKGGEMMDLPNPELFDCSICGVSVKYKKEHLNKKHQIDEEVYEELIEKKSRGEDISEDLPDREVFTCLICERECMDLKRHLQVCHKLSEEQYSSEFLNGSSPVAKVIRQESIKPMSTDLFRLVSSELNMNMNQAEKKPGFKPSHPPPLKRLPRVKHDAEPLSTDLQCYFNCQEVFKKDYQLFLHLKLKHRLEDPDELEKAYAAAKEEIALTRRSASLFNCALCPREFNDNGAFYGHIQNKHDISYKDYKEKYGRCETESKPFECNICSKVIKYDRNTIHTHLKNVHGINWTKYLERIRKTRRGVSPDPLPTLKTVECRVCNITVKYLRDHLRNAHKITEQEYEELFTDGSDYKTGKIQIKEEIENNFENGQESGSLELDLKVLRPSKLEIQNKGNRNCSVCEFEFDSRKEFIEHCQVIHGMKFKTKTGVSIPPPTQATIKRRVDEIEQADFQPEKKFRTFETSDGYEIEIEGVPCHQEVSYDFMGETSSTSQFTSSLLSKWNLCQFQCAICSKTSNSKKGLMGHIMTHHGLGSRAYKESYPDIEINTEWFNCRVCRNSVKFMKDTIVSHIKTHGLNLEKYEREYMEEEDWPYHPNHQSRPGATLRRESLSSLENIAEQSGRKSENSENSDENISDQANSKPGDIWNRCEFQCKLCSSIYIDRRTIRSHIQNQHKIHYKDYISDYGDPELPTPKWICRICGAETRHARNNIYTHLRECHSLTIDQYAVENGIPGAKVKVESIKWSGTARTAKTERWNKCIFKCPLCEKESTEKKNIRQHVQVEHDAVLEDLEQQHGDCESHTEYFFCQICSAEVKHCYKNIQMHLQRSHEMNIAAYESKFLAKPISKKVGRGRIAKNDGSTVPCEKCGKKFSSNSNKQRHKRDYCAFAEGAEEDAQEELGLNRCPVSGCGMKFDRSLQMKKHLGEVHKINQNVSVKLREADRQAAEIKQEPEQVKPTFLQEDSEEEKNIIPDSTTGEETEQSPMEDTEEESEKMEISENLEKGKHVELKSREENILGVIVNETTEEEETN